MREKLKVCGECSSFAGITPAYAGKTMQIKRSTHLAEDHPRVCGKNQTFSRLKQATRGSPPRMREKLQGYDVPIYDSGITPAYAGKTL